MTDSFGCAVLTDGRGGIGTANAHADFDGISSILDITSGVCEGTFIPFPADCPFVPRNPVLVGKVFLPPVANDGNATISGQPFTLEVQAVDPNNANILANFNGAVAVNFPEISGPGESSFPANVQLSAGKGLSAALTLTVVTGTRPGRLFTLQSTAGNVPTTPGSGLVNVWFQQTAFLECADCTGSGTGNYRFHNGCGQNYSSFTDACAGGTPNYATFVAMANPMPCGTTLLVDGKGMKQSISVGDHTGNSVAYWNTGGTPTFMCLTEGAYQLFGFTFNVCSSPKQAENPAVLWRFP